MIKSRRMGLGGDEKLIQYFVRKSKTDNFGNLVTDVR
jgi:hypothetical protein